MQPHIIGLHCQPFIYTVDLRSCDPFQHVPRTANIMSISCLLFQFSPAGERASSASAAIRFCPFCQRSNHRGRPLPCRVKPGPYKRTPLAWIASMLNVRPVTWTSRASAIIRFNTCGPYFEHREQQLPAVSALIIFCADIMSKKLDCMSGPYYK